MHVAAELPGTWKVVTVWLLLGLAGALGVNAWQAQRERAQFHFDGQRITLQRAADGHYHWPGSLNGRAVVFLVDTGATRSAVPAALARELGLAVLGSVSSNTAGGLAQGELVRADLALQGGVAVQQARLVALPRLDSPLLGMDVLGKLTLRQSGAVLSIEPGAVPP